MAKNTENMNPFHEESHEDEAVLYKNDKKHSFVPPEQIPDTSRADVFEDVEGEEHEPDEIDSKYHMLSKEDRDEIRSDEADERKAKLLASEIKVHQREGVASVGPDIQGTVVDKNNSIYPSIDEDNKLIINRAPESMNPRKNNISDNEIRKSNKSDKRKNEGHDNYKKKRHFRNFVKDLFGLSDHTEERMQSVQDTIDLEKDSVNLNGKPIDKKFTEERDIAA